MVLVTLCVAAAMAAPTLSGFGQGRRIGACASQVLSLARFARTQAVTRATLYRLNVDPAAETFWLTTQDNSGQFVSPGDESGRVFKAPPGVRLDWIGPASEDGKSCYVEFLPTGRCDAATIRLTDARGVVTDVTCPSAAEQFKVVARGGGAG
jgi:Tfp pilus assembly protein FimT